MTSLLAQSARILAAPWQQRRNRGSLRSLVVICALALLLPVLPTGLVILGLDDHAAPPDAMAVLTVIACLTLVGGAWTVLVANVLEQNHPALARQVPGHVPALRRALVVAAIAFALPTGLFMGWRFGALSAGVAGAAAALAAIAAAVRWNWLCFVPSVALPFLMGWFQAPALDWLLGIWHAAPATAAAAVVVASVAAATTVIQSGDDRHVRFHARRAALRERRRRAAAGEPAAATSRVGWTLRPYAWWFERLVARRGAPMGRLMLGLGASGHWTSFAVRVSAAAVFGAFVCAASWASSPRALAEVMLPATSCFAILFFAFAPLQAGQILAASRREQALLVLLPGVPRGGALSRALALRLLGQFMSAWLAGVVLMAMADAVSEAMAPGASRNALGAVPQLLALSCLPLAPLLMRRWSTVGESSAGANFMAYYLPLAPMGAAWVMLHAGLLTVTALGIAYFVAGLAACAWRWRRMATEPSALPVGRMAA